MLFTCLTMNPQPMHLDVEYSASHEFGKPLVNSLYTLGLVVGILGFDSVNFPHPVFAGDTGSG